MLMFGMQRRTISNQSNAVTGMEDDDIDDDDVCIMPDALITG
jgi:hypothetical protein